MTQNNEDTTFVRITNKDIYELICKLKEDNTKEHSAIVNHQKETNGKVKKSLAMASLAITLVFILLGFLFNHLNK